MFNLRLLSYYILYYTGLLYTQNTERSADVHTHESHGCCCGCSLSCYPCSVVASSSFSASCGSLLDMRRSYCIGGMLRSKLSKQLHVEESRSLKGAQNFCSAAAGRQSVIRLILEMRRQLIAASEAASWQLAVRPTSWRLPASATVCTWLVTLSRNLGVCSRFSPRLQSTTH